MGIYLILNVSGQTDHLLASTSNKTRLMHRRTDANLYLPVRQLTKANEPSFDLEGDIRRFPVQNILEVGFTLQTSRINNKRVISPFKFGCPRLTLKEGLKVKSDNIKRFPARDFL